MSLYCQSYAGLEIACMDPLVKTIDSATSEVAPGVSGVLAVQIVTFTFMKLLGVTGSLYIRGCSRDGEGINFNTALRQYRF